MNSSSESYWLCWSPRQNAFYVEAESQALRTNAEAFIDNVAVDYVPIARFRTFDAARLEGIRLTPQLHARTPQTA